MLAAMVSENRKLSSKTMPMAARSDGQRQLAHVRPPTRTAPAMHVVEPRQQHRQRSTCPSRPRRRRRPSHPAAISRARPHSTGLDARRSRTPRRRIDIPSGAGRQRSRRRAGPVTSGEESMTSSTRSTPARACWPMVSSAGEHADRADQLAEIGGERQEGAERDLAVQRQPAAERPARRSGPAPGPRSAPCSTWPAAGRPASAARTGCGLAG